jgi:polyisoprenoid-binding protein YceI
MKKLIAVICLGVFGHSAAYSQLYLTRTGFVGFYSKTSLEDIKAENNQVYAVIDAGKKNIAFSMLLKGFIFAKELMQEHFNENYVESDKYPKASFTGVYEGDVILNKDGAYPVKIKGSLTLHNVTRQIEEPGTLEVKGGKLVGKSDFKLRPEDFNMTIPSVVRDKIEKEVTVHIQVECTPK